MDDILPACAFLQQEGGDDQFLFERVAELHNGWRAPSDPNLAMTSADQFKSWANWQAGKWSKKLRRNITTRDWTKAYQQALAVQAQEGRVGGNWMQHQTEAMRMILAPDAVHLPNGRLMGLSGEEEEDETLTTPVVPTTLDVEALMTVGPAEALSLSWGSVLRGAAIVVGATALVAATLWAFRRFSEGR